MTVLAADMPMRGQTVPFPAPTTPVGSGPQPGISYVNSKDLGNNGGPPSSSLTTAYTVGSGSNRVLWVAFLGDMALDLASTVKYNSVSMTLAVKLDPTIAFGNRWTYLYYLVAPASGNHNVEIVFTAPSYILALCADYQNAAQSGQPDATNTHSDTDGGSSTTTTLTTITDNAWGLMVSSGYETNNAPSAGAGAMRRTFDAAFGTIGLFDSNGAIHPAGAYNMTWTYPGTTSQMITLVAGIKPL